MLKFRKNIEIFCVSFCMKMLIVYRFLKVVFGVTTSPFLLNGTIRHHLPKYLSCDQRFVERLLEDLHVDDVTSGTKTIEQGK